jgi:glutathione S-transferase
MAINLYLARKSACSLAPADLWEEGQATQWSFWAVTEVEKPLLLAACNRMLFAEHERSPLELDQMLTLLQRPFAVLDVICRTTLTFSADALRSPTSTLRS